MYIINKENKNKADEIVKALQFISKQKCEETLKDIGRPIDKDQLIIGKTYYISEFGKIQSDKPNAFFFTMGEFIKSNDDKIIFSVHTAWGSKEFKYNLNNLILMEV